MRELFFLKEPKSAIYSMWFVIPMIFVLGFLNWRVLIGFLIIWGVLFLWVKRTAIVHPQLISKQSPIRFFGPLVFIGSMTLLLFVDKFALLILGSVLLVAFGTDYYRKKKISGLKFGGYLLTGILIFNIGLSIVHLPSESVIPADFTKEQISTLTYIQYDKNKFPYNLVYQDFTSYDRNFKAMYCLGISTSRGQGCGTVDLTINIENSQYLPWSAETDSDHWMVYMDVIVITLNSYIRTSFEGKRSYDLANYIQSLIVNDKVKTEMKTDYGVDIFQTKSEAYTLALSYNDLPQGEYLLVLDMTVKPSSSLNKPLYDNKILREFDHRIKWTVEDTIESCADQTRGYTWTYVDFMPEPLAPALIDDIIGTDTLNIIGVFFILFACAVILALVEQNVEIIHIMQSLIYTLMMLSLLAIMANAMEPENISGFIKFIFNENAGYVSGIFALVKTGLLFVICGIIIWNISSFLMSTLAVVIQESPEPSLKLETDKKRIRFRNV